MSTLVSPYEQSILTGLFGNTFDTFSNNRQIVVWKSPIKTVIPAPQQPQGVFGFGNAPEEQSYQYTPVSGVFPAVIRYWGLRHVGEADVLQETNAFLPVGPVKIKVRQDCYDFIQNGTTDKISFDGRDFYFEGIAEARPFLGSIYYIYQLKPKI
jgi:hypothetical protein